MKRRHLVTSASAIACVIAALLCSISARAFQETKEAEPVAVLVQPPATFAVAVDADLTLDPNAQLMYDQMAILLSTFNQVPNDRLNYYSAVNTPPNFTINGWGGLIQNISDDNGVKVVTVFVTPELSSIDFGPATYVDSDYSEIYRVTGNAIQYFGFTDPLGWGGQFPPHIIGM